MPIEFAAVDSGFEEGLGGASTAVDATEQHYILFGKDGAGVYFEWDDQSHGGIDQVAQISIAPEAVVFALRCTETITPRKHMDDVKWSRFIAGIRRTFPAAIVVG